jgi:glycosyltransferase involved in cell wall biosynthesis
LKKLANELNLSDRCSFLGYNKNATSYLSFFDLYVMSSYSEGFPLALLEAGMKGIPVICSDIPIFKETFTTEDVSFFKVNDIDSLVRSIIYASQNAERMSKQISKSIESKYSVKVMGESYLKLYENFDKSLKFNKNRFFGRFGKCPHVLTPY